MALIDQQPDSMKRELNHYQQRYHWDCGLSCVLMCLSDEIRKSISQDISMVCREEEFGTSTWTIDLCYLILHRSPKTSFYYTTTTLGVDPGYGTEEFYDAVLKQDTSRVMQRFEKAADLGVNIKQKSISTDDIINHITNKGVCIVLTNSNLLSCDACNYYSITSIPQNNIHNKSSTTKYSSSNIPPMKEMFPQQPMASSFQGHYVVVCGYDLPRKKIIYRNPSLCDRECEMSFQNFENARSSYGTDDDVIFVDISSIAAISSSHRASIKERAIRSKIKTNSKL